MQKLGAIMIMGGFIIVGVLLGIMNSVNPDPAGFILSILFIVTPSFALGVILRDLNSMETE